MVVERRRSGATSARGVDILGDEGRLWLAACGRGNTACSIAHLTPTSTHRAIVGRTIEGVPPQ